MGIHEQFSRMNPTTSNITLVGNYDNHTITIWGISYQCSNFKGSITGPIYNYDIDFVDIVRMADNVQCYCGYKSAIKLRIQLVITFDEPFDPSEVKTEIAISNTSSNMNFDNMAMCVFKEVMPMKGVHDG